jgi:uridine phosphorylase
MYSTSDLILNTDGSVYHLRLKPHQIANTIITVGDPERVAKVSAYFDKVVYKVQNREFITHTGLMNGKEITVMSTGMGTDNFEIALMELDMLVNIDLDRREPMEQPTALNIIRLGTSGSLQPFMPIDSVVVTKVATGIDTLGAFYNFNQNEKHQAISKGIQKTLDLSFLPYTQDANEEVLLKHGFDFSTGYTITCPGFYAPQGRKTRIANAKPQLIEQIQAYRTPDGNAFTNFEMETAGIYAMAKLLGHKALSFSAIVANRAEGKFSTQPELIMEKLIKKVLDRH